MAGRSFWPNSSSWRHYWPSCIVALIATIQFFFSFAILAIQIGVVVIGIVFLCNGVTPRYVMGFVCWGFFFACWISIFCVTCCNRSSVGCATYVLIKNILAFIFSAVLIDFDRKFIDNPYFDYNYNGGVFTGPSPNSICSIDSSTSGVDFWYISVSLTKGQLAGAVVILVTSLLYVGIYIYVYIRALGEDGRMSRNISSFGGPHSQIQPPSYITTQPKTATILQQPSTYFAEPPIDYSHQPFRSHDNSQNIRSTVYTAERF